VQIVKQWRWCFSTVEIRPETRGCNRAIALIGHSVVPKRWMTVFENSFKFLENANPIPTEFLNYMQSQKLGE